MNFESWGCGKYDEYLDQQEKARRVKNIDNVGGKFKLDINQLKGKVQI